MIERVVRFGMIGSGRMARTRAANIAAMPSSCDRHGHRGLQPGIDGLTFEREDAKDAFVDPAQRLAPDEAF